MTDTLKGMTSMPKEAKKTAKPGEAERAAARELVKAARARGEDLTGPDGLLKMITATVLQAALEEEMSEHLGHDKHHAPPGEPGGNIRNGTRPKTVPTDAAGKVDIEAPRDRAGTFEPVIVKKRQRRLNDVDAIAISCRRSGPVGRTPTRSALRRAARRRPGPRRSTPTAACARCSAPGGPLIAGASTSRTTTRQCHARRPRTPGTPISVGSDSTSTTSRPLSSRSTPVTCGPSKPTNTSQRWQ